MMGQINARGDVSGGQSVAIFTSCKAKITSNFSCSSVGINSAVAIPLTTSEWDTHAMFNVGTGRIDITRIGSSGLIKWCAFIEFEANATGDRGINLKLYGTGASNNSVCQYRAANATRVTQVWGSNTLAGLDATTSFELGVWQNSGVTLNVTKASLSILVMP